MNCCVGVVKMTNLILQLLREINENVPDDPAVDLLAGGYLDSFAIANLVAGLEDEFSIEFSAEDIVPENFNTIVNMEKLVSKVKITRKKDV